MRILDHLVGYAVSIPGGLILLQFDEAYPVDRSIRRNAHHQTRPDIGVAERRGEYRYHLARERGLAPPRHQRRAMRRANHLDLVLLQLQFLGSRTTNDPDLAVHPDIDVLDIGVQPEVGEAEYRLRPQGRRNELPAVLEVKLQKQVLKNLGVATLGDIRLGRVDSHGAVLEARGCEVRSLDQEALYHQLPHLPLDELRVIWVDGARKAPPIRHEAEPLPVVVDVHLIEEPNDLRWIGELGNRLFVAAVRPQHLYGRDISPLNALRERYRSVACRVRANWEEHLVTGHHLVANDSVREGVSSHVADMKISRHSGVGENHEELLLALDRHRLVDLGVVPGFAPLLLDGGEINIHLLGQRSRQYLMQIKGFSDEGSRN